MKRSTIIVVLIALGLGAYWFFFESKNGKGRDENEKSKPAYDFKSEDVASITINNKGQSVAVERTDKGWTITQPIKTEADSSTVDSMISSISTATIERSLALTDTLKRGAGLAQPELTIDVRLKNNSTHQLQLGKKAPTEGNVYAIVDQGNNVLLLPASLLTAASKTLNDLRSKEILKISEPDLTNVRIKNQNTTLVAEKNGDSKWVITEPADKKNKEVSTGKLFSLLSTSAIEIIDTPDDKIKTLLTKPVVEVEYRTKDKTEKLSISAAEGENIYIRVEGRNEIFKIGKNALDSLNFKINDIISEPPPKKDEKKEPSDAESNGEKK